MEATCENMVLKRKHSPTPVGNWDNLEHNGRPNSPSSSADEASCESAQPKRKRKKQVKFNGVTVYYFQRSQGFTCVPSQGGSTLGMEHIHEFKENYSLNAFALEQDRQHRELLKEQLLQRKQRQMLDQTESELLDKSIQEIADNELATINVEEYYFLQPVNTKRRRIMLRSAGVTKIESWEKSELKKIRLSREKCGCDCKVVCNPSTCACSLAGIKCQVDRLSFPCGCSKESCGNVTGRVEFNPIKVRTHFLHTLMRLEVENGKVSEDITDNDTDYTKLENSVYLDESTDRVLDHGQCKECDSIPYSDYSDQYTCDQYLNGQKPGEQGQFIQQLDSNSTPMNFSCTNTNIPLDLQSHNNSNNQCDGNYDGESNHNTLNMSINNLCNVSQSDIGDYASTTSDESVTSESDSEPPYVHPTISVENTDFGSTSSNNIEKSIFQTPDSSPEQQYTKLMPLDLSHALGDFDTCGASPTYTQLSTTSRSCPDAYYSQVSHDSYTNYLTDCHHFASNASKAEKTRFQKLNTITSSCTLGSHSDFGCGGYNLNDSRPSTEHTADSNMQSIDQSDFALCEDESTVDYFNENASGQEYKKGTSAGVHLKHFETNIISKVSSTVKDGCFKQDVCLPSNEHCQNLTGDCQATSQLQLSDREENSKFIVDKRDISPASSSNIPFVGSLQDQVCVAKGQISESYATSADNRFIVKRVDVSSSSGDSSNLPFVGSLQEQVCLENGQISESYLISDSRLTPEPDVSESLLFDVHSFEESRKTEYQGSVLVEQSTSQNCLSEKQLSSDNASEYCLSSRDNKTEEFLELTKAQGDINKVDIPLKEPVDREANLDLPFDCQLPQDKPTADVRLQPLPAADNSLQPTPAADSSLQPAPADDSSLQPLSAADNNLQPVPADESSLQPLSAPDKSLQPTPVADSSLQPTPAACNNVPAPAPDISLNPIPEAANNLLQLTSYDKSLQPIHAEVKLLQPTSEAANNCLQPTPEVANNCLQPISVADNCLQPTSVSADRFLQPTPAMTDDDLQLTPAVTSCCIFSKDTVQTLPDNSIGTTQETE
ncbi:uncharacterized protein [Antedon mediterranea]|uniref:uncharacterized protein n=1 Tax=Antedon mediterranea TaxID=105859 RepID=UPI003AF677A5